MSVGLATSNQRDLGPDDGAAADEGLLLLELDADGRADLDFFGILGSGRLSDMESCRTRFITVSAK